MPKQMPHIPLPGIQLNATATTPLHRQLYEQLSQAIRLGHLTPGTRLPSTRAFAKDLGISRTTVEEAYQDLHAEGYIEGRIGAGTHVVRQLPETLLYVATNLTASEEGRPTPLPNEQKIVTSSLSQRGILLAATPAPPGYFSGKAHRPFRIGLPALDHFPQQEWARTVARITRSASTSLLSYQDPAGYRPLREEIAAYLTISRGVRCTADQVIIVSGAQTGLVLAAHLLLDVHDVAWIEDPGYSWAKAALQSAGITLVPVPVDEEGLNVAIGKRFSTNARLAYVTPSHQFPLGVTMSLARRYELLRWAQQSDAWILEDDYDSEYRYIGRPIPALQGLDEAGRVIYLGTFSKVLFPALRLGYIVAPPPLVEFFIAAQRTTNIHLPVLEQSALASFMADGHFARHLRRMRSLYAERGNILKDVATRYLGNTLIVERPSAGLHVVGWLPEGSNDYEMAHKAYLHGIDISPLSTYRIKSAGRSGILLGYAALTEHEIREGMQHLARAWS